MNVQSLTVESDPVFIVFTLDYSIKFYVNWSNTTEPTEPIVTILFPIVILLSSYPSFIAAGLEFQTQFHCINKVSDSEYILY